MRHDVVRPAACVQFLGRLFVALLFLSVTAGCGTEIEMVNPEVAPVEDLWKFTSEAETKKPELPAEMLPPTTSTVVEERTSEVERHFNAFDESGGEYVMVVDPRTEGFPHVLSKGDLVYRAKDGTSTVVDHDVWTADVSDDGRTLVVWKDPGVIEVKRDDVVIRTIENADFPRVSPDGTMVVVHKNGGALFVPGSSEGIGLIDIASGTEILLSDDREDFSPFWLDNEWVMVAGATEHTLGNYTGALFTVSTKSRERNQITNRTWEEINSTPFPIEYPDVQLANDVAIVSYETQEGDWVELQVSLRNGQGISNSYRK